MEAGRELSSEQRERITQNFKQAKIIRDRKRSQIKANMQGLPSLDSSAPYTDRSAAGRLSLDSSTISCPDFRSPLMKKMNNAPSPLGMLPRKALTEIQSNTERGQFHLRPPQELRSISKDILDCAPMPSTKENQYNSHREEQSHFPGPSISSSAKLESTPVLTRGTNAHLTGNVGQDGVTDGLSQTFDDAVLQEIDALCQQKSFQREGSLQSADFPVKKMVVEPLQGPGDSVSLISRGKGVLQGLPNRSVAPKELSDTSPLVSLHGKEANTLNATQISTPVCEVLDRSQSSLIENSNLESQWTIGSGCLNGSIRGQLNTSGLGDVHASTAGLVILNEAVPPYLQKLNSSQRDAATSDTTKPLLILAGPGSGKTSTMVARLLTLMEEGVQPANILAMTFTTAAATEMRERVAAAVGKSVSKELVITTFHSFCLQLCRSHADKLGRTSEFLVFGHGQQRKAVVEATRIATSEQKACKVIGLDENQTLRHRGSDNPAIWKDKARKWQQFVAQAKCAGKTSEEYEKAGNVLGAAVLRNYEKTLATCDALDYHDFITFAANLLNNHQEVLEECQKAWTCILVDEFQDTSTMQYRFLRLLASHNRITIVGDDDQSIFGFNGANSTGFESFRGDFPGHKEVRLHQNYRSTRCIVEAASALIKNNLKRCQSKQPFTDNILGEKIEVRECRNEPAQCALVADCILMNTSSSDSFPYGNIAVLYRRQVTGKLFQAAFRARKIPFNVHGVAFYRKKVIKNITALLWMAIPGRKDIFSKRVFKALYSGDKAETKKVLEYVEKIAKSNACDFLQAAAEIFPAKISGTFNRRQLALGKKVLASIRTLRHVVSKEQSLSAVVTTAATLLPQRPIFDKRAVVTEDGGKLLNEDEDPRTIMEFLLDDVNDFLSNHFNPALRGRGEFGADSKTSGGCLVALKSFLDHLAAREEENFRGRRLEDKNSVTLTTMHQSKGLEWDTVFIVKVNDTETPLLHEGAGCVSESSVSLEEERRLFYVAMTRARKKLYLTYVVVDSQRQVLQPSQFLHELPRHLLDLQDETVHQVKNIKSPIPGEHKFTNIQQNGVQLDVMTGAAVTETATKIDSQAGECIPDENKNVVPETGGNIAAQSSLGANTFLKGFNVESRSVVALLFHTWAKKPSFQDPYRLLSKVGFVIDERLRTKGTKNKDVLISHKCALRDEAALSYARHSLTTSRKSIKLEGTLKSRCTFALPRSTSHPCCRGISWIEKPSTTADFRYSRFFKQIAFSSLFSVRRQVQMDSSSVGSNSVSCPVPPVPPDVVELDFPIDSSPSYSSSSSSSSDSDDERLSKLRVKSMILCLSAAKIYIDMLLMAEDSSDSDDELPNDKKQVAATKVLEMVNPNKIEQEMQPSGDPTVLAWEKLPAEERAVLQAERQEHFQQQNSERSQAAAPVTPKQLSYLRTLGCTVEPTSRLHASRLIEQYKKL